MAGETLASPQYYDTRMSALVTKAKRLKYTGIARDSDPNSFGISRYIPEDSRQQEQREFRRDSTVYEILKLRAEEIAAGYDHAMFGNYDKDPRPYSKFDTDVHLYDRERTSFDHELSQHELEVYVGPEIFHTTVDAVARTQGLTSLDIIALVGEGGHGGRSYEDSAPQSLRFISEINAVQKHKKMHPEAADRMNEIERNLVNRLIHLWKTKPGNPLIIGMQRTNFDTGEGRILFASKPKYDYNYGPIRILDINGNLDKGVAAVVSSSELEAEIKSHDEDGWVYDERTDYDFWITTSDEGVSSVVWNPSRYAEYSEDDEF